MTEHHTPAGQSFLQKLVSVAQTKRAKRVGIGVVAFFALYTVFGFFIAPSLIKDTAETQITEQMGRSASIGHVALNPYTLRLQVDDIHIAGRQEQESFVDVGQFVLQVSWSSLVKFTPVIAEFTITQPQVHVIREDRLTFNFSDLLQPTAEQPAADAEEEALPEAKEPFNLILDRFLISKGAIHFTDKSGKEVFRQVMSDLTLGVNDISITGADLSAYSFMTKLENGGVIGVDGKFNLASGWAETKLSVNGFAVSAIQPYLAEATPAQIVDGTFDALLQARADWSQVPFNLTLSDSSLSVKQIQVALPDADAPAITLADAGVQIAKIDLASQTAKVSRVNVTGLSVDAVRLQNQKIDLMGLLPANDVVKPKDEQFSQQDAAPISQPEPSQEDGAPWQYVIEEFALEDARAHFTDQTTPTPAKLSIAPLNITVRQIDQDMATAFPVTLDATLNDKGSVSVAGDVTVAPLNVSLKVTGDRLDLTPLGPYAKMAVNAKLASAFLNASGDVVFAQTEQGEKVSYDGNLSVVDVQVLDQTTSDAFAGWGNFALNGLQARYDTVAGADVNTKQVLFEDFHGHVLLDAKGRLQLQDVLVKDGTDEKQAKGDTAGKSKPAANPATTSDAPPVKLHFGQLKLKNGRAVYTDNFIRPNYTAKLEAITGTVGAFGTQSTKAAPIDVKARLTANGPIAIKGKVNPLATLPSLDLTASAKGIELTNLTAYSTKYVGYPINKGKLNVGLAYKLANDKLTANNHIFIDQLTFGQHVENDTATSLPVLFAINLMTDTKGQIDINIPVSGSLDDPEFSIGGLVWRAIGNLITKAITSPFSLLASAFGESGEELDFVQFAPGSAVLSPKGEQKIETLAKMLAARPSINLSLTGHVDAAVDEPALRTAYVQQQVLLQKFDGSLEKLRKADAAQLKMTPEDYLDYLEDAYEDATFDRPRNALGFLKSQPKAVMEEAMYVNAPINASSLSQLALDRTEAVRRYLKDKVAEKRIFTVAAVPKDEQAQDPAQNKAKAVTTRVDFTLK